MTTIKTNILFLVVIFLTLNTLTAQTKPVEHIVVKGDNVYRLSLRYGVPMESIFQLNSGSRTLIRTGETIFIPPKGQSTSVNNNTSTFENHFVSKGETKYGLSKQFNISIAALEEANPNIVRMLIAGQTIQIPSKSSGDEISANTNVKTTTHTVKKGENLWLISQQYNMSLSELRALNKAKINGILLEGQELSIRENAKKRSNDTYMVVKGDTKFGLSKRFNTSISRLEQLNPEIIPMLKKGTTIKTGISKIEEEEEEEIALETVTSSSDSIQVNPQINFKDYTIKPQETLYGLAKKANMSIEDFLQLNPSLKESVTKGSIIKMPTGLEEPNTEVFSLAEQSIENSSIIDTDNAFSVSVVWNDSSALASVESKNQKSGYYLGLKKAIDSMNKLQPNNKLQIKGTLANQIDLKDSSHVDTPHIFLYPTAPYRQNINSSTEIDMMSLTYKYQDSTKTLILKGLPTEDDMRKSVLTYLKEQNGHIISIYDESHAQNKNLIDSILPKTDFIPTRKNGTFNSNKLNSALQPGIKNFIIIESDKVGVYLSSTNILLKEMSNFDIQLVVLNQKNIPSAGAVATKRFKILQLLYPKQYNSTISKGLSKATALGFAFNYDVLQRIFKNGLETFNTNTTTSVFGFSFNYTLKDGVYKNKSVLLFVFDENSTGTQIDKN